MHNTLILEVIDKNLIFRVYYFNLRVVSWFVSGSSTTSCPLWRKYSTLARIHSPLMVQNRRRPLKKFVLS